MFEASICIAVKRTDNDHMVKSQIMTAAPTTQDLMSMLSSMLMSHTDVLIRDVQRMLPDLEAQTIKTLPVVDELAPAAKFEPAKAAPGKTKPAKTAHPQSSVKIDEPAAPAQDKQ